MEELKGLQTAKHLTEKVREMIDGFQGVVPVLCIVRMGEDPSDLAYERGAVKRMEKCGISTVIKAFPRDMENAAFLNAFKEINEDPEVDGILLMRPLPKQIDSEAVEQLIDPMKDIDCIHPLNMEKVFEGKKTFYPCTAQAVMEMIDDRGIELSGKRAVIVGRSMVVGKPLAMMMLQRNATVTICHSRTENLSGVCCEADILTAAVGRAEMITGEFVKEGAYIFDVGINVREDGTMTGDCHYESVSEKAAGMTPVPGGVGSVTTSVLALHTAEACRIRRGL